MSGEEEIKKLDEEGIEDDWLVDGDTAKEEIKLPEDKESNNLEAKTMVRVDADEAELSEEYERNWKGSATFSGRHGQFYISNNNEMSVPVDFLQTNIHFTDPEMGELETFREIFDTDSLSLEQILQRDIDDTRVSTQMIPYLLSSEAYSKRDFIPGNAKFYPPVVAILVPLKEERDGSKVISLPAEHYSKSYCAQCEQESGYNFCMDNGSGHHMFAKLGELTDDGRIRKKKITSELHLVSGEPGSTEMWRMNLPVHINEELDVSINNSKSASINVNTKRCKVVIIDGQHRAMSVLALYRNSHSKMWEGNRMPYEIFYKEWTIDILKDKLKYSLDELTLPLTLCVVPEGMISDVTEPANIERVARQIFLTLNKTAKPVSETRNQIMDDQNMISELMRAQLKSMYEENQAWKDSIVHGKQDEVKNRALPIHFTSTDMIYRILNHITVVPLNYMKYVKPRDKGRGRGSIYAMMRLDRLLFSMDLSERVKKTTKEKYNQPDLEIILNKFGKNHSKLITMLFSKIELFKSYAISKDDLKSYKDNKGYTTMLSMVFGGNQKAQIFSKYKDEVSAKMKELGVEADMDGHYLKDIVQELEDTTQTYLNAITTMKVIQHDSYLNALSEAERNGCKSTGIAEEILKLGTQIQTQMGVILTFFDTLENAETEQAQDEGVVISYRPLGDPDSDESIDFDSDEHYEFRQKICEEYIGGLNSIFKIESLDDVNRLAHIFRLKKIENDNGTFKRVDETAHPLSDLFKTKKGEEYYPHYSLVFNLLWKPKNTVPRLDTYLNKWITISVKMAIQDAYKSKIAQYKRDNKTEPNSDQKADFIESLTQSVSFLLETLDSDMKDEIEDLYESMKESLLAGEDLLKEEKDVDDDEDEDSVDDDEDDPDEGDEEDSVDESEAVTSEAEGVDKGPPEAQDSDVLKPHKEDS